jgi:hypothetical protein
MFENDPTWVNGFIEQSRFEDESKLINLGFPEETDLHNINIDGGIYPSSNSSKIISLQLQAADTVKVTSRETYSILPYCGDIGGLY